MNVIVRFCISRLSCVVLGYSGAVSWGNHPSISSCPNDAYHYTHPSSTCSLCSPDQRDVPWPFVLSYAHLFFHIFLIASLLHFYVHSFFRVIKIFEEKKLALQASDKYRILNMAWFQGYHKYFSVNLHMHLPFSHAFLSFQVSCVFC